jgi:glycosyltransferase involved in cell wall biosynthesis
MGNILYVWADPRARIDQSVFTGSTSHVFNLLNAFQNAGYQLTSILPGENLQEKKAKDTFGRINARIPDGLSSWLRETYEILYDFQFQKRYKGIFQNGTYDFIYERLSYFHQSCSKYAKILGLPYIVEVHSIIEARHWLGDAHFSSLAQSIQNRVMKRAHAITVVSRTLRDFYIRQGYPPGKIHVVPNAVDEIFFDPGKVDGKQIRRTYDLEDKTVIGLVSSMKKYHGVDLLLKAMERVVKNIPKARLLLVGADENIEHSLGDSIIMTGAIPYRKIPQFIASMDFCAVSILDTRGSPIKIFEYGAMRKPVIAPDLPAIRELLIHNETGFLFRPGDADSLAESILHLIQNHDLSRKMGDKLREHILKEHTWRKNAERILNIYKKIDKSKETFN